ncbi:hypothetical protein BB560_001609 [Smittium megazygosporum]|uniref:Uncharacterized protein n=1 Tax=Smittium megazygosporum TaxID=133381 RepID=A0A2T9ZH50_9FUNG|nr:hypothetical protein BB560_001609 [Smittium megazygosporum]
MSEDHIPQAGSTEFSTQRTELRLPDTMKFDGNPTKFKEFMARMSLHFWANPETFKLIMGNSQQLGNFDTFMHLFAENFSDPTFAVQARSKLEKCRQFDLEGVEKICAKVENRISELQATQYTGYSLSNFLQSSATNKYSQGQNINKDPDAMDDIWQMTVKNVPSNQKANLNIRQEVNVGCLIDTGASKTIDLIPTALSHADVILGIPRLRKHNPAIDFEKHRIKFNSAYCVSNCLEKSTNLDTVFKVPDDEDSDYGHTTDFDQNATNNNPESADTDSDTYETASKGEPNENKTQIHHGNLSSNATLSKDPSEFETLKSTDTLLPREYTIFAPLC